MESYRGRLAPTRCAPALSAADISHVHIRVQEPMDVFWEQPDSGFLTLLRAIPSRGVEESREGPQGQQSKGSAPTRAQSVEKSCCERVKRNPEYGGSSLLGRRQQS